MLRKDRPRRGWNWRSPLQFDLSRPETFQEILAGILGWQTVVTSFSSYAALFVEKEDLDEDTIAEIFMFAAGVSTIVFGLSTDLPFLVAPSVLYVARQSGITMGGQLAAQALANAAATLVLACAVKLNLVSYIPTALRVGAGCGVAMLVGVLGMRSVGLLVADAFILPPFTWEAVVGLALVTAASTTTPSEFAARKWIYVLVAPLLLTVAVYATFDRSKFAGYSSAANTPLTNWRGGSFGLINFSVMSDAPGLYMLYILRTFFSIVINVSSVLLVLIDTVCLQRFRGVLRSAGETDFSDAIGGTKKFRRMACTIPMMSFIGNLAGVTTQAAFVESMIVVFAGGKTGLSAAITGLLLVLSTVLWPLLPILVPSHISGALTIVVTLRFFTVIRMVDVTHTNNLLMFGVPVLLVPFSYDFEDAICVATLLGFVCGIGNKAMSRKMPEISNVGVSNLEVGVTRDMIMDYEAQRRPSLTRSKANVLSTIGDGNSSSPTSLPDNDDSNHITELSLPLQTQGRKGLLPTFTRHKVLPDIPLIATPKIDKEELKRSDSEPEMKRKRLERIVYIFSGCKPRQSRSYTKDLALSESSAELPLDSHVQSCRTLTSLSAMGSSKQYTSGGIPHVDAGPQSKLHRMTVPIQGTTNYRQWNSGEIESGNLPSVHWKLALVATLELALKVIVDQFYA